MGIPDRPLRARGNLSYLDFIRLLGKVWVDSIGVRPDGVTPRVPFQATDTALSDPDYPLITYSLQMRKPLSNEPKAKVREMVEDTGGHKIQIKGQRFENYVKFSVLDRVFPDGVMNAEEILDIFETFMEQMTPLFKELGLSDIFYGRRDIDMEKSRPGTDVVERSVVYIVITEKVTRIDVWKLEQILVSARTFLVKNQIPEAPGPDLSGIITTLDDQLGATPSF